MESKLKINGYPSLEKRQNCSLREFYRYGLTEKFINACHFLLLNNTDATSQAIITQNQTYTSIFYTYNHDSSYEVQIVGTSVIPGFSAQTALTLILLLTFVLAATSNKRKSGTRYRSIRKAHALIFPHHSKTNIL